MDGPSTDSTTTDLDKAPSSGPIAGPVIGGIVLSVLVCVAYWLVLAGAVPKWEHRGQFGDSFGSLNALFSALALAGVVWTLVMQRQELSLQREELRLTREELKRSAEAQKETAESVRKSAETAQSALRMQGILAATYSMEFQPDPSERAWKGRTKLVLVNPSTLVLAATVRCSFRVEGNLADSLPEYDGKAFWWLYPGQNSAGWFDIAPILAAKGVTADEMHRKCTDETRRSQFTMDLEIEFEDETGDWRLLPSRRHFFDFRLQAWIPELTSTRSPFDQTARRASES